MFAGAPLTRAKPNPKLPPLPMKLYTRKLNLCSFLGDRFRVSVSDLVLILADRRTVLFICLALLVMSTTDAPGLQVHLTAWMMVINWSVAIVVYLATGLSILMLFGLVQARFPALVWPMPVSSVLAVFPAAVACEHLALYLAGNSFEPDILARLIVFAPTVQVFETVFYRYILPGIMPVDAPPPAPLEQTAPDRSNEPANPTADASQKLARHIVIGDQKVPVAGVRHIEAHEHHVRVTLDNATITRRARLSDIVAQTRPEDGCQPHRSWWVSRNETIGIEREGNRHVLKMKDDIRIPVARTRLSDVQLWLRRHVDQCSEQEPSKVTS